MSIMRVGVSSLLRVLFFTAAICAGRGFVAMEWRAPQSAQQTQARDALDQGVQAFKDGQYDEAIRQFERAKDLDPTLLNARLYLATAYASQYIPGAPSDQNRQYGLRAIEEFKGVLFIDGGNLSAIDGIGSLLYQMAGTPPFHAEGFLESKTYHLKHIQIKPDDPEPYYWIGVIDWTLAFRANSELRMKFNNQHRRGIREDEPLPANLREQYAREYGPTIDEGIDHLKQAISLKPDYDDAMAYLNLLYRRKADTVATETERQQLTQMADELIDKVREIKQKRQELPPPQR